MFSSLLLVGIFSGIFFLSLSSKHLKFWVESYLNTPSSKLHFQFKDIKLSLSQWGVLPIIGLKSSLVEVSVKPFENTCFDVDTLRLNTVFIKVNPINLLLGKLYFSSIEVDNINLDVNTFCENLSSKSFGYKMSYFMHHKAEQEIDSFIKWIDQIEVNKFILSNQFNKLMLIKNLKLKSYQKPKFILLSGETLPYLNNSFKTIESIQPKIFIYPHSIKTKWWWHLQEGVVKLNTQLLFSASKHKKPKYQSQLRWAGSVSYLPVSSALNLLYKNKLIDIKFSELNTWLSCSFNGQLQFFNSSSFFSKSSMSVKNCKLKGLELVAHLKNSDWKIKPFRAKQDTHLYFSKLYAKKFVNPFLAKWIKKSDYFMPFSPAFGKGSLSGTVDIFKTGSWKFNAKIKDSVLNFKKDKKLEWFSVSSADIDISANANLSSVSVELNNISTSDNDNTDSIKKLSNKKNTKLLLKYKKTNLKKDYTLNKIRFDKKSLSSLKGFPFLEYLEKRSKELKP